MINRATNIMNITNLEEVEIKMGGIKGRPAIYVWDKTNPYAPRILTSIDFESDDEMLNFATRIANAHQDFYVTAPEIIEDEINRYEDAKKTFE